VFVDVTDTAYYQTVGLAEHDDGECHDAFDVLLTDGTVAIKALLARRHHPLVYKNLLRRGSLIMVRIPQRGFTVASSRCCCCCHMPHTPSDAMRRERCVAGWRVWWLIALAAGHRGLGSIQRASIRLSVLDDRRARYRI